MNKLIETFKSFYGLVIYFGVTIIFSYLINNIDDLSYELYYILLLSMEICNFTLLTILYRKRLKKDFIDFDSNYKKYLTIGFKAWIIGMILMVISNGIIQQFIDGIAKNQEINQIVLSKMPLYSVIGMVVCGPYIEELAFRLGFKEHINNKVIYYILTILIFAGAHALNGISSAIELLYFIPYSIMAFTLAYILDKTDNIFTSVIIHTSHNTIAVMLLTISSILGV